jgi:hypothetical protein
MSPGPPLSCTSTAHWSPQNAKRASTRRSTCSGYGEASPGLFRAASKTRGTRDRKGYPPGPFNAVSKTRRRGQHEPPALLTRHDPLPPKRRHPGALRHNRRQPKRRHPATLRHDRLPLKRRHRAVLTNCFIGPLLRRTSLSLMAGPQPTPDSTGNRCVGLALWRRLPCPVDRRGRAWARWLDSPLPGPLRRRQA